jgi:hypothetical protein
MFKKSIILIFIVFSFLVLYSQSKKEVKKFKIKSVIVSETIGTKTVFESKTVFDKNGETMEEVNYNKDGEVKSTHKFKRNSEGDVIEETEYDSKNALKERREVKYNSMGEKSEEYFYGADSKLIKKHSFTYNKFGLKTERKVFDASNKLIALKKYQYTY